jgi:preprotein translocase subunit SecE
MNEADPEHNAGGGLETAKLVLAIVLVLGGIAAYYVLRAQPDWQRWLAVVAGVALAIIVFGSSARGQAFWSFVVESRVELRKVVWPTRQETGMTTLAVFLFVIVAGTFFWVLDVFLSWATRMLTGQGG